MKEAMLFLLLLLLIPVLATAQTTYEDVITDGISYDVGQDTLHLLTPVDVAEERIFEMHAVLFYQEVFEGDAGGRIALYRDNELVSQTSIETQDNPLEETYIFLTWTDVIEQNSTYSLVVDDQTIDFYVEARELQIVDQETSQITIDMRPPSEEELGEYGDLLWEKGYKYDMNKLNELLLTAQENIITTKQKIVKTITYEDNTTRITTTYTITVQSQENLDVLVIEDIPKKLVPKASNLDYEEGQEPIVLKEDPVVMWHLDDVTDPRTSTFVSDGEAQVNGNTIVLAGNTIKVDLDDEGKNKGLILSLILIPLVALIIIFFARYEPKR